MRPPEWPGLDDLRLPRRWPLAKAVIGFALYFAAVVGGSTAQTVLGLHWRMGWLQQTVSLVAVIVLAVVFGSPRQLLGLARPRRRWVPIALVVGLSITLAGFLADLVVRSPLSHPGIEYFTYEATMPGVAEEFAFRGLLLGLLATAALQHSRADGGGYWVLVAAAAPFAALHQFEASGWSLLALFVFTLYAGTALGWLRMNTASIWPAIVAHNIANVAGGLIDLIR